MQTCGYGGVSMKYADVRYVTRTINTMGRQHSVGNNRRLLTILFEFLFSGKKGRFSGFVEYKIEKKRGIIKPRKKRKTGKPPNLISNHN